MPSAGMAVEHGEVASAQDAARSAPVVQPMCLAGDAKVLPPLGIVAEEEVAQGQHGRVVVRLHGEVAGHGGMERGESFVLEDVVQGGDVAEADEPLGLLAEAGEVQLVHQMYGPVAPAAAKDGTCLRVVQRLLEVPEPLGHGAGIRAMRTAGMRGQHRLQSPRLQSSDGSAQEGVALAEAGRINQAFH